MNHAEKNIVELKPVINEMVEIIEALNGSSGQWAEEWLNQLAAKCSNIASKFNG